jgi:ParB family transcriptional regulator, chromosome partitioning protein
VLSRRSAAAVLKDRRAEAASVRELRAWIEREVHLDLSSAPFDPQDAALVPLAGSCAKCPKRTGNNPLLFPESSLKKSTCTDRQCFRAKVEALVEMRASAVEKQGEAVLRVSEAPAWQPNRPANVLHEGQFHRAARAKECPTTKPAVQIDGRNAGSVFHVCQNERCPVHGAATRYQPSPEERERRQKEALAERIEKQTRLRVFTAIRSKLPASLARPDLEMVARDYFLRLGHDNERRICRVLGWQKKKTKSGYGSAIVDYPRIAQSAIEKMDLADLHRFLLVCTLASDLCSPPYGAERGIARDSNLARTAARYRLDVGKITAEVRSELTKKQASKTRGKREKTPPSRPPKAPTAKRDKPS